MSGIPGRNQTFRPGRCARQLRTGSEFSRVKIRIGTTESHGNRIPLTRALLQRVQTMYLSANESIRNRMQWADNTESGRANCQIKSHFFSGPASTR